MRADFPLCCVKMLVNTQSIHCAFSVPDKKSAPQKLFDLKKRIFEKISVFEVAGGLTPSKAEKRKGSKKTPFQAGSDYSC